MANDMTIKMVASFKEYKGDDNFDPTVEGATTTSELIQFGLREGGTLAEYYLAKRLHEMREALFNVTRDKLADGQFLHDNELELLDVDATYMQTKRICT